MYLHLGQSVVVPDRDILAICDLDNASWAYKTRATAPPCHPPPGGGLFSYSIPPLPARAARVAEDMGEM